MRWKAKAAAVAATSLVLVGCVAVPEVPYDRSTAQVKTVAIVTPQTPETASVVLASTVGQSFGLIGALIDAGMQANREATFRQLVDQQRFSMRETFVEALKADLVSSGYEVKVIDVPRSKSDFLETYPASPDQPVDAYLDISSIGIGYGYVAAGIGSSTPYRPTVALKARLVNAKDRSVLMQNTVTYNPIMFGAAKLNSITIPPDPEYQFNDFDTLVADPPKAITGLRTATEKSAHTIGTLLK